MTLRKIFSAVILMISSTLLSAAAFAQTKDLDHGGKIRGNVHSVSSQKKSRAEYRYKSVKGSQKYTLSGDMKIKSLAKNADLISIIQVLNVTRKGKKTGSSKPISQLGVMRDGRNLVYFIVQGRKKCSTKIRPRVGAKHNIKVEFKKGGLPKYIIRAGGKSMSCSGGKPDRRVGKHNGTSGLYFYGKLGAYLTAKGKGPASVEWTRRKGY